MCFITEDRIVEIILSCGQQCQILSMHGDDTFQVMQQTVCMFPINFGRQYII